MRVGEVLKIIPGLSRDTLAWWEYAGYLTPELLTKGRVSRREYRDNDIQLIKAMWAYYSQGFPPRVAYNQSLRDLGWEDRRVRPKLPTDNDNIMTTSEDRFFQQIFEGQDLSLEEICQRAGLILTSREYRKVLHVFIQYLPIEEVAPNLYRYKRSDGPRQS